MMENVRMEKSTEDSKSSITQIKIALQKRILANLKKHWTQCKEKL